jgi:hypothetical protein
MRGLKGGALEGGRGQGRASMRGQKGEKYERTAAAQGGMVALHMVA